MEGELEVIDSHATLSNYMLMFMRNEGKKRFRLGMKSAGYARMVKQS